MAFTKINGVLFKKMVINGAINLKNHSDHIDELNVFPVPDGDTGTNMQMTMFSGVREIKETTSKTLVDITKLFSRGLLMGARGNSGVILSQFFRGVHIGVTKIANGSATLKEFIECLVCGYETAYKAVMDPKEGTILTVVREAAENLHKNADSYKTVEELLIDYISFIKTSLDNTPNLLPVLKEAGVIDSGGAGFLLIAEGMLLAVQGNILTLDQAKEEKKDSHDSGILALENVDIKFGYCTEFILILSDPSTFQECYLKDPLSQLGDSLVCVVDEELVKIHVHTNTPEQALALAHKYGEFKTIKIENMRIQHSEILSQADLKAEPDIQEHKEYGIISVCSGAGIKNAFTELGVNYIIDGGQTMNPSADQFVEAVKAVNADKVIILPNNSNVILAAEQSKLLMEDMDTEIAVLRNKSIATGYTAMILFDPEASLDENLETMSEKVKSTNVGEITFAIRNTTVNGVKIHKNDFMGIANGKIVSSDANRMDAIKVLLDHIVCESSEIVTIFYGTDVHEEELEQIKEYCAHINKYVEFETLPSDDDIYSYTIAVE